MNLSSVDVNLFVVLHMVLEERSATRAAKRLHVTQSAVSNAIARLLPRSWSTVAQSSQSIGTARVPPAKRLPARAAGTLDR